MRENEDREDGPRKNPDARNDSPVDGEEAQAPDAASSLTASVRLPAGFTQSLVSGMGDTVPKMLASFVQAQMTPMLPDLSAYTRNIVEPVNGVLREQIGQTLPTLDALGKELSEPYDKRFSMQMASIMAPVIDFPTLKDIGLSPVIESLLGQISDQQSVILESLRGALKPLSYPESMRALLPPNLRSYAGEVWFRQVYDFLAEEGIPLYLVPRGRTALRLLRAQGRSARRQVLGDCYESIIDDCAAVLEQVDGAKLGGVVEFVLDGIGAMRAGHPCSAQAMFTVTLDTLISRFYPDRTVRGSITNRKKGADVPDTINEMGVHKAMVWLPIWNAHEQFWKHKGSEIPRYYSRHASVHGVSSRQFSKRNCVQVLMLVTSLIGYADHGATAAD